MPVCEFDGHCVWLECARLAWNLSRWIEQLAVDEEVVRWDQPLVDALHQLLDRGRQKK